MDHHSRPVRCPRCASGSIGGTGAVGICGRCGKDFQLGAPHRELEPAATDAEVFAARRRIRTLPLGPTL